MLAQRFPVLPSFRKPNPIGESPFPGMLPKPLGSVPEHGCSSLTFVRAERTNSELFRLQRCLAFPETATRPPDTAAPIDGCQRLVAKKLIPGNRAPRQYPSYHRLLSHWSALLLPTHAHRSNRPA